MRIQGPFLLPSHITNKLPSLRRAQTRKSTHIFGYLLGGFFFVTILVLIFAPWQQTSEGLGQTIAFNPLERQQTLGAPVKGRVVKWHVTEGSLVKKGELIAEMADNDPQAIFRMQQQRAAITEQKVLSRKQSIAYQNKVRALKTTKRLRLRANRLKILVARQKLQASRQKLRGLRAALRTARINLRRKRRLLKDSIVSQRSLEVTELKVAKLRADMNVAKASVTAARAEVVAARAVRMKKAAEDQAKVDSALAESQKAQNKEAYARSELAKLDLKMGRQASQSIRAPRDVILLRLMVTEGSEMLKAGDPIAIIVPQTKKFAVELWVDGNDVPLLTKGRHVRLQFEGWPAVQFSGWPSVAVGTFGGLVSIIDVANSKNGKFRVVVTPDPKDAAWPKPPFLRQGMKAKGWLFLNEVRLGYEIWRQLNGFPPSFDKPLTGSSGKNSFDKPKPRLKK